jgi:hypothetical protein
MLFTQCRKEGCTDPLATNFDADAKKDDGTCEYVVHEDHDRHVHVNFEHAVGTDKTIIYDSIMYTTAAMRNYSIITLKYFVSDFTFNLTGGGTIEADEIHYVDGQVPTTHTYHMMQELEEGEDIASVTFTFGIDSAKNVAGLFINPPQSNMEWPVPMGPGYHYMKLEGKWDSAGMMIMNYNVHTGQSMGTPYTFDVTLPASAFVVGDDDIDITIEMDVNNWFTNPTDYDFDDYGMMIMGNAAAQAVLQGNGIDVFSLVSIQN